MIGLKQLVKTVRIVGIYAAGVIGDCLICFSNFWGLEEAGGETELVLLGNFHWATSFLSAFIRRSLSEMRAARLDGGSSLDLSGIWAMAPKMSATRSGFI